MSGAISRDEMLRRAKKAQREALEDLLASNIMVLGLPTPEREYDFEGHDETGKRRGWRFDFAWPDLMIAAEIDGGTWTGGRHTRGKGFQEDAQKGNAALKQGWRVFHFTGDMVTTGEAVRTLEVVLAQ